VSEHGTKHQGALGRLWGAKPAAETTSATAEPRIGSGSWLDRLRQGLDKTSTKLSDGITGLFTKRKLDASTLQDLEDVLIEADLGLDTAERIVSALGKGRYEKGIEAEDVRAVLKAEVERVLAPVAQPMTIDTSRKPHVVLVVGVNGTGKTTTIGKLAAQLSREGKSVMLAAGDTFRAAAIDQLKIWGERTGSTVVARDVNSDATGLVFDALTQARAEGADVLLVDTAGRLQNKEGLMEELAKVIRVLRKVDPTAPHEVLLVLDATTGQNALSQVEVFRERAGVTGLVMTKLDGTARGGILVAISAKHGLPVRAIGVGEGVDDLQPFDPGEFAEAIAGG
jgi:fused signal recognition particle receptor